MGGLFEIGRPSGMKNFGRIGWKERRILEEMGGRILDVDGQRGGGS